VEGNPISKSDPFGLDTYQCTRKLHNVPFRFGPLYHQYVCTGNAQSGYKCGGLGPTGSMFDSPGVIEKDNYKPSSCEKTKDDNQCIEKCINKKLSGTVPNYSVNLSHGQNCQTYANGIETACSASCKGK